MNRLRTCIAVLSVALYSATLPADTIIFRSDGSKRYGTVNYRDSDGYFVVEGKVNGVPSERLIVPATEVAAVYFDHLDDNQTPPPPFSRARGAKDVKCRAFIVGNSTSMNGILRSISIHGILIDKTHYPREQVLSIRIDSE
jgi:hypothetical protein